MKKLYIFIIIYLFTNMDAISQSMYMHEAQEESGNFGDLLGNLLGWLTFIGIGLFVIVFIPLIISNKISDTKFCKKFENRYNIINTEAFSILDKLAIDNSEFLSIKNNPRIKEWFRKGYYDGVDHGETEIVRIQGIDYKRIPWEEFSSDKFSKLSREDVFIKFECGSGYLSELVYDEGRRHVIKRRKERGDLQNLLN